MEALQEHVQDFSAQVADDPGTMTKKIMHSLRWGKADASNGLLFAGPSQSSTLLLWSGANQESREKWCNSLGMFMSPGLCQL